MRDKYSQAAVARVLGGAVWFFIGMLLGPGETNAQRADFVIHGGPKTCSAISQMDSALSSRDTGFFSGWTERDYADALAWAEACSAYGWHVPGRSRVELLRSQHDGALGAARPSTSAVAVKMVASMDAVAAPVTPPVASPTKMHWSTIQELPPDGSTTIGFDAAITAHYKDTLPDIARHYGLGYEEIHRANPGVDVWLPGEGTRILLPGRHRLPPGSREGVVVDVAARRLYFFPKPNNNQKAAVITYPVSIGKSGQRTPLGQTLITAKVEHPSWHPPAAARKEHAERGEWLPAVVDPGPDNPLGDFMMRLGFGDGSYEIHGTNKPVSIGMETTNGCIGMYPEDVAALFALVDVGTPVRLINGSL